MAQENVELVMGSIIILLLIHKSIQRVLIVQMGFVQDVVVKVLLNN